MLEANPNFWKVTKTWGRSNHYIIGYVQKEGKDCSSHSMLLKKNQNVDPQCS